MKAKVKQLYTMEETGKEREKEREWEGEKNIEIEMGTQVIP